MGWQAQARNLHERLAGGQNSSVSSFPIPGPGGWPEVAHLYLAPHLDDAVLSCGGMVAQQAGRGESVAVVTIFAGSPPLDEPLSAFAQELHDRWQGSAPAGIDFGDPPAVRREEDRRALGRISPAIRAIHLPLADAIYRRHPASGEALYASEAAIFGPPHPDDPALTALIESPVPSGSGLIYAPLSAGGHVDHRIVRQAVENWGIDPARLRWYEDYPYAGVEGAVEAALGAEDSWASILTPLDDETLAAKVEAIAAHESQINTFWASVEAMGEAVRAYAARVGGERVWMREAVGPNN
jgi:LmbE family N-acetylglucosaminyl deacetylase